jgi:hypothetical protein
VEQVAELAASDELRGASTIVVDATGVSLAVRQMLRQRCRATRVIPVTITGGERQSYDGQMYRVPKRDLIVGLQVAFETREVGIVRGLPQLDVVRKELMTMQVKVRRAASSLRPGARASMMIWCSRLRWRDGGRGGGAALPRHSAACVGVRRVRRFRSSRESSIALYYAQPFGAATGLTHITDARLFGPDHRIQVSTGVFRPGGRALRLPDVSRPKL